MYISSVHSMGGGSNMNVIGWSPIGQSEQFYQGGGGFGEQTVTSYWWPPLRQPQQHFGYAYWNNSIHPRPPRPRYSSPASPLIPIQAFHADFPDFAPPPSVGYPVGGYFLGVAQAQLMPQQSLPMLASSNQNQPNNHGRQQQLQILQNSVSTTRSNTITSITSTSAPVIKAANQMKTEVGNETMDSGNSCLIGRSHLKTFNSVEVRVRKGRYRRGSLYAIDAPELKIIPTEPIDLNSDQNTILERSLKRGVDSPDTYPVRVPESNSQHNGNYAPAQKQLMQLPADVPAKPDVKQEFQRKIKEAATKDQTYAHHNGTAEPTTPTLNDVKKTMAFPSPLQVAKEEGSAPMKNLSLDDVVDSGPGLQEHNNAISNDNENVSITSTIDSKDNLHYADTASDDLADLESNITREPLNKEHYSFSGNKAGTVCLDTDTMQRESDDTTLERRRRCIELSDIAVIVYEYHETGNWENTEWRISHSGFFETSAGEFIQELVMWAVNKGEPHWHIASGTILRLMIKTGMTNKLKVLEIFTLKFIEDRPSIQGLHWTMIFPRLVRLLVEIFFNEGNLDWLSYLRQLILQNPYNLESWEILATQVVRVFEVRTNKDFVVNLVRQTKTRLPEILPAVRDPIECAGAGAEQKSVEPVSFPPIVPPGSQCSRPHTPLRPQISPVYSTEILEASAMLSSLQSKNVKWAVVMKPLCSQASGPGDICAEDVQTEVVHQNVYFLAKLLRNSDDLLTILHHFRIINSTNKMELKAMSSEFTRFVGILAAVVTKDESVIRTFLTVLRQTNNTAVADILDSHNTCL